MAQWNFISRKREFAALLRYKYLGIHLPISYTMISQRHKDLQTTHSIKNRPGPQNKTHTFQEKQFVPCFSHPLVSWLCLCGEAKRTLFPYPFNPSPVERPCPKIWPHLSIVRCHWRTPPFSNILIQKMHFHTCLCPNLHIKKKKPPYSKWRISATWNGDPLK